MLWQKYEFLVGEKICLVRSREKRKAKINIYGGRGGKNGTKEKFSVYLWEKISFRTKMGMGKNIICLDNIYPCFSMQ